MCSAGNTEGMVEVEEGVKQSQQGVAVLGPLSPPSLLAHFFPLGLGLQTLVRLMGASWAPEWSLGYGFLGVRGFSFLGGEKRGLRD